MAFLECAMRRVFSMLQEHGLTAKTQENSLGKDIRVQYLS